jgi:formiminotetrahydrofolate cyclodeaminase
MRIEEGVDPGAGSIRWLEALSAARVSPAAGSAAAFAGALGVALLIKLARLTRLQDIPDQDRLLVRLLATRDQLVALADADSVAITAWIRTRRLPSDDPVRQATLRAMVDVPLEAAELCQTIAIEAQLLLERGYPSALLDGQVGIQLLNACQRATCSLVWANLPALADASLIEAIRTRLEELNTNSEAINGEPAGADPQPAMIHRQA